MVREAYTLAVIGKYDNGEVSFVNIFTDDPDKARAQALRDLMIASHAQIRQEVEGFLIDPFGEAQDLSYSRADGELEPVPGTESYWADGRYAFAEILGGTRAVRKPLPLEQVVGGLHSCFVGNQKNHLDDLSNPPGNRGEILAATTPATFEAVVRKAASRGYCQIEEGFVYPC
jgi:hypothetical protein